MMNDLMRRLSTVTGLEQSIENMLALLMENIGGTSISLYYYLEGVCHYTDVSGAKKVVEKIEDPNVLYLFETGQAIELKEETPIVNPGDRNKSKTTTWLLPLKVGDKTIGVLQLSEIVITAVEIQQFMDFFLDCLAMLLQKEINSYQAYKTALDELSDSNKRINFILNATITATWEWNVQTGETKFNENWAKMVGYTLKELVPISIQTWMDLCQPDDLKAANASLDKYFTGKSPVYEVEFRLKHKDGHWVWILDRGEVSEWTPDGKPLWMSGTHQDITRRKLAEMKLDRANHLYAVISQVNQAIVHNHDRESLFMAICQIAIEYGDFRMAWIGLLDDTGQFIKPHSFAGYEAGYLSEINHIVNDAESVTKDPIVTAIRANHSLLCNDVETDPDYVFCRDEALQRKYRSMISLPLNVDGEVIGLFNLYAEQAHYFDKEEIKLLEEVTHDINYALHALDVEKEHQLSILALEENEKKFRTIFNSTNEAIFIHDAETGKVIDINQAASDMYGYTKEEFLTFHVSDFSDNRELYSQEKVLALLKESREKGEIRCQWRGKKKNSEVFWNEVSLKKTVIDGSERILAVVRDIDERTKMHEAIRESEERYRLITENASDVICVLNTQSMRFTYISPAIFQLRGVTVEEAMKEELYESLTPASYEQAKKMMAVKAKEFVENSDFQNYIINELQQICKDGRIIWTEVSMKFRYNKRGEIELVGVSRNIDERKKLQEELQHNQEQLSEALATKDKFFSIIAHDLKSPFNSILGFSNLLVEKVRQNQLPLVDEYANIIKNASQGAYDLLLNLLEWSRAQTGRMEYHPDTIDLNGLINDIVVVSKEAAHEKSITLFRDLPHNATAYADKEMLGTILRNLVSNAIKFTNPGGAVSISVRHRPADLLISVKDNGVGIPVEALPRLFRIDESYTTKGTRNEKGTGLGLILCKEFIEKHNGQIWVESELGIGSTFYFTIPR